MRAIRRVVVGASTASTPRPRPVLQSRTFLSSACTAGEPSPQCRAWFSLGQLTHRSALVLRQSGHRSRLAILRTRVSSASVRTLVSSSTPSTTNPTVEKNSSYASVKNNEATEKKEASFNDVLLPTSKENDEGKPLPPQPPPAALSRDSLNRLVELSRQEWKLIALSAATLGITSSITLILPLASGQVIDYTIQSASGGEGAISPMLMASGLFGLTSIAGAGVYLRSLWLARAGNRIVARLKQQLYASLLLQESAFLEQQTVGDLLSRLSADAQMVQNAVTYQAVAGLRGLVMSLGSASMLLYTSPTLAAVSVCTLPPIFIVARRVGRKLQKQQEDVQKMQGEATSLAEQALSNVSTVKQFVAEERERTLYHNAIAKAHSKALDTAHMQAQLEAGAHVAGNGAVLCVLGYGGTMVLGGVISAGDLTGFIMYSLLMAGNLSGLTSLYGDLVRAVAASNRVFDILDRQPQIQTEVTTNDESQRQRAAEESPVGPLELVDFSPHFSRSDKLEMPPVSIDFDSVNFSYPSRTDVQVLKDFSLSVSAGESVAIVGYSGSGKSTVAGLLTRLYDVETRDSIRINGKAIRDYDLSELRRMIGVVPQDTALFRGTIRENIAYGEWSNASEARILEAARLAHVLDFVDALPEGLDTFVGPRGSQLSGGQRQRIAIARVLVKNAPLVIFDEATANLDGKSEHFIEQAMKTMMTSGQRTVLSIAHRLSTVRTAERIAVLDHGSVVQTGTFQELSTKDGPFRELMETQLVGPSYKH